MKNYPHKNGGKYEEIHRNIRKTTHIKTWKDTKRFIKKLGKPSACNESFTDQPTQKLTPITAASASVRNQTGFRGSHGLQLTQAYQGGSSQELIFMLPVGFQWVFGSNLFTCSPRHTPARTWKLPTGASSRRLRKSTPKLRDVHWFGRSWCFFFLNQYTGCAFQKG